MCGITGFVDIRQSKKSYDSKRIIEYMTDVLKSRGPDDKGIWIDEKDNICLGHRRLSIIGLNVQSNQPMKSIDEEIIIVFNGDWVRLGAQDRHRKAPTDGKQGFGRRE